MENLYRLYTQNEKGDTFSDSYDSIFDLVGHNEPDQTKSLGYVLSKSDVAMKSFLKLLGIKKKDVGGRIVDCELRQQKGDKKSARADIVIRFHNDKLAIFVEAKSASTSIGSTGATHQVENYKKTFARFDGYNSILTTLTSYSTYTHSGNVKNITWSEIIEAFRKIDANDKNDKYAWIAKEYVNYLLKINRVMYYDIEVLSIPAGGTIKGVTEAGVYECLSDRAPYKSRGEHKPLFIAFRESRGGMVKKLYKVADLISTPITGPEYEMAKEGIRKDLVEKIEKYKEAVNYDAENGDDRPKWVFFLDEENSIKLPHPVIYKRNNSFVETQRPLKDYFAEPNSEGFVVF